MTPTSRIPFDPREERVVSDLARWMNLLGRFQIIAATFIFILLLAAVALITTAEVLEPATRTGEQPLVSIGEVSRTAIAVAIAIVVAFSLIFLRGGMQLISSAEDLELMITTGERKQLHLDGALKKLRSYFILEAILMAGIVALVYAATILQGSSL